MPDFGRWTSSGGDPSLNEINRTDRFLDALASEQPVYSTDPGEAELAQLMAGWRDEIRTPPLTAPVTPRDAVLALDRTTAARRRGRASLTMIGSVAAAVLCLGGFGAVVAGAGPGDALYGLRIMLFGEQQTTRDDAVVLAAQTQMAEVQQLIDQGQWDAAQDKLQTLTTTVATVNDVERKEDLVSQWQELTVKVESKDANATVPPNVPPPSFPDLPAVVLDTTTTSETTTPVPPSSTPLPTPSPTPLPTPSPTPIPTPIPTPLPTPIPTPSTPLPTPSPLPSPTTLPAPLPTPSPLPAPTTPLPTPTPKPLPTPTPKPLPTPTTPVAIPTRVPLPTPTPEPSQVVEQEEAEPAAEPPILQAPPPQTVVTTTVELPKPPKQPDEPR